METGHGRIGRGGRGASPVGCHRAAYELFVGPIPEGHDVHHTCQQPSCVNPHHLVALTRKAHKAEHLRLAGLEHAFPCGHTREGNAYQRGDGYTECVACRKTRDAARWASR